jgi:hypothetical protein
MLVRLPAARAYALYVSVVNTKSGSVRAACNRAPHPKNGRHSLALAASPSLARSVHVQHLILEGPSLSLLRAA